jgi:hypothetical protein
METAETIQATGHVWRTDSNAVKEDGVPVGLDVQGEGIR